VVDRVKQIHQLNQVQRILLLLVAVGVMVVFWYGSFSHYQQSKSAQIKVQTQKINEQIRAIKKVSDGRGLYFLYAHHLVSADETIRLIKQVFNVVSGVRLLSMKNMPAKSVSLLDLKKHKLDQKGLGFLSGSMVEAHDLHIKMEGTFFGIESYLKEVELTRLPILWHSIDYKVTHYPYATVTIKLRTLSKGKEWLRV
jgi:MSHA biogenesis protein MshJ